MLSWDWSRAAFPGGLSRASAQAGGPSLLPAAPSSAAGVGSQELCVLVSDHEVPVHVSGPGTLCAACVRRSSCVLSPASSGLASALGGGGGGATWAEWGRLGVAVSLQAGCCSGRDGHSVGGPVEAGCAAGSDVTARMYHPKPVTRSPWSSTTPVSQGSCEHFLHRRPLAQVLTGRMNTQ